MLIAPFAAAAAAAWAVIGFALGESAIPRTALVVLTAGFVTVYGLAESLRVPLRTPSARWQVPSGWVVRRRPLVQATIWGIALGPGIVTRNPYASIWLLPLAIAFAPSAEVGAILGAVVGTGHGVARAVGVLANLRAREPEGPLILMGQQLRWRFVDGLLLLATGGAIVGASL